MILGVPKDHITQEEMWGGIDKLAQVAVKLGNELCPNGFRLVSNFGFDGEQSQLHGHIHVLGGRHLGYYMDGTRQQMNMH